MCLTAFADTKKNQNYEAIMNFYQFMNENLLICNLWLWNEQICARTEILPLKLIEFSDENCNFYRHFTFVGNARGYVQSGLGIVSLPVMDATKPNL